MSGINNNLGVNAALRNLGTASTQAEKTQNQPADKTSGGPDFASQLREVTASVAQSTPAAPQSNDPSLNSLINTGLETEAAKLQALQVQQQLGSQSNAIVNQRASTILSLFNKG